MKRNRLFVFILCLLLAIPLAACAETFEMMGLEEGEDTRNWESSRFFDRMADITGVSFTFRQYTNSEAYEVALREALENNNMPDVLFKARLTPQQEMEYYEKGYLVDLAPYLEEYAPTLYAVLEARPDWREIITQPNGAITSLPILNGAQRQPSIWINRQWLQTLGLDMPSTIDEYTEALRAFQEMDPNGNGKKDEVPLSLVGPTEAKYLLHAFGLAPNDYNIYVRDDTVFFAPFEEAYRDFVAWLHMALEEGLLAEDTFRTTHGARSTAITSTDSSSPNTVGGLVSTTPYTLLDMSLTTGFAVLRPLEYEGERIFRETIPGAGRGAFAITAACEDIGAVLAWADYLYTEEGGRLAFAGLAGEDYTLAEDGTWQWNYSDDISLLTALNEEALIAGDTVTPGLEPAAFMRNSEITMDNYARRQSDTLQEYLVRPFPVIWPADNAWEEEIADLQFALGTCVDTAIANFAMGKQELTDESWDAFQEELRALGAERFVALWQARYDALN